MALAEDDVGQAVAVDVAGARAGAEAALVAEEMQPAGAEPIQAHDAPAGAAPAEHHVQVPAGRRKARAAAVGLRGADEHVGEAVAVDVTGARDEDARVLAPERAVDAHAERGGQRRGRRCGLRGRGGRHGDRRREKGEPRASNRASKGHGRQGSHRAPFAAIRRTCGSCWGNHGCPARLRVAGRSGAPRAATKRSSSRVALTPDGLWSGSGGPAPGQPWSVPDRRSSSTRIPSSQSR